jgi:hypothetical protein
LAEARASFAQLEGVHAKAEANLLLELASAQQGLAQATQQLEQQQLHQAAAQEERAVREAKEATLLARLTLLQDEV